MARYTKSLKKRREDKQEKARAQAQAYIDAGVPLEHVEAWYHDKRKIQKQLYRARVMEGLAWGAVLPEAFTHIYQHQKVRGLKKEQQIEKYYMTDLAGGMTPEEAAARRYVLTKKARKETRRATRQRQAIAAATVALIVAAAVGGVAAALQALGLTAKQGAAATAAVASAGAGAGEALKEKPESSIAMDNAAQVMAEAAEKDLSVSTDITTKGAAGIAAKTGAAALAVGSEKTWFDKLAQTTKNLLTIKKQPKTEKTAQAQISQYPEITQYIPYALGGMVLIFLIGKK